MLIPAYSKRVLKSIERCGKRGYNMLLLENIMNLLIEEEPLPSHCRPHKLIGNYAGHWECHIKFDWVLVYRYEQPHIIFEDTGTHSDLF